MSSDEAAPSGFNGFLEQTGLNIVEFAICLAFWVGMAILSSIYSVGDVLSIGPIAVVVDGLSAASEYMPAALAALGLLAMAFAIFKYRASVAKSLLVVVRKITRSKGR